MKKKATLVFSVFILALSVVCFEIYKDLTQAGAENAKLFNYNHNSLPEPERYVNPFLGTGGFPHMGASLYPGASYPFGQVKLSPDTISAKFSITRFLQVNNAGFHLSHTKLLGFSHDRLSGAGQAEGGSLRVLPGRHLSHRAYLREGMPFEPDNQKASVGFYSIYLSQVNTYVSLTATTYVGYHDYTYEGDGERFLFIDLTSHLAYKGETCVKIRYNPHSQSLSGTLLSKGGLSKKFLGIKKYFFIKLSDQIEKTFYYKDDQPIPMNDELIESCNLELILKLFEAHPKKTAHLQVAFSYTNEWEAENNWQLSKHSNFELALKANQANWHDLLGKKILIKANEKVKQWFYTSLYRSLLQPIVGQDVSNKVRLSDLVFISHPSSKVYYDFSFWDTVRTVHPLIMLFWPQIHQQMLNGLSSFFMANKNLPTWLLSYKDANVMSGMPIFHLIFESLQKGFSIAFVSQMLLWLKKKGEEQIASGQRMQDGAYFPKENGFGSVSESIDWAWTYKTAALTADRVGQFELANLFNKWADGLRELWHSERKLFIAKDRQRNWNFENSSYLWSFLQSSDYLEGHANHWRWGYPFNLDWYISLWPSKQELLMELDQFFANSTNKNDFIPKKGFWLGNEHNWHALYFYLKFHQINKVTDIVHKIILPQFDAYRFPGQDDGGALSAFYVWLAIGLLPDADNSGYWLLPPLVESGRFDLGGEKPLSLNVFRTNSQSIYLEKVIFDGQDLSCKGYISHQSLWEGGELAFYLVEQPVDSSCK